MRNIALPLLLLSGSFSALLAQAPASDVPHGKLLNRHRQRIPFVRKTVPMPLGYQTPSVGTVTVGISAQNLLRRFSPDTVFGAGVDSIDIGTYGTDATTRIYTPNNIAAMLTAGQRTLSYRLYTELGYQAWHWNPQGKWSDSANGGQGYFLGSTTSKGSIVHSFGFKLPHRGATTDNASGDGYSRLTDKAETTYTSQSTYWKIGRAHV